MLHLKLSCPLRLCRSVPSTQFLGSSYSPSIFFISSHFFPKTQKIIFTLCQTVVSPPSPSDFFTLGFPASSHFRIDFLCQPPAKKVCLPDFSFQFQVFSCVMILTFFFTPAPFLSLSFHPSFFPSSMVSVWRMIEFCDILRKQLSRIWMYFPGCLASPWAQNNSAMLVWSLTNLKLVIIELLASVSE